MKRAGSDEQEGERENEPDAIGQRAPGRRRSGACHPARGRQARAEFVQRTVVLSEFALATPLAREQYPAAPGSPGKAHRRMRYSKRMVLHRQGQGAGRIANARGFTPYTFLRSLPRTPSDTCTPAVAMQNPRLVREGMGASVIVAGKPVPIVSDERIARSAKRGFRASARS